MFFIYYEKMNSKVNYGDKPSEKEKYILIDIYENIYTDFQKNQVDIFLCGGSTDEINLRNFLKENFEKYPFVRIFYPEAIFEDYFKINKNTDYLTLENWLATQVDFICIACESWGSVCELGAFTNVPELKKKLIVLNHENFKNSKSFITLGPVKHMEKQANNSVYYYNNSNKQEILRKLKAKFKDIATSSTNARDIYNLTGLFYFIALLVYFFKKISLVKLSNFVKYILIDYLKKDIKNFDTILSSTKKLLFNENFITRIDDQILITKKAELIISEILNKNYKPVYNKVISDIISCRY